jgi:hypothetical protein
MDIGKVKDGIALKLQVGLDIVLQKHGLDLDEGELLKLTEYVYKNVMEELEPVFNEIKSNDRPPAS